MTSTAASTRRDHLINVACDLFSEHGFHGTGIDRILAVAGVSKKTLYKHFRSKEELILAVLRQHDSTFRNQFMRAVEETGPTPRDRLLGIFDVAGKWFEDSSFFGCLFISAVGEYSAEDTAIRDACRDFKRLMRDFIVGLAEEAGARDAKGLGEQLALLLEGAIVTAQVSDRTLAAGTARQAARTLIDQALEKTPTPA